MQNETHNKQILRQFIEEVWNKGDAAAVDTYLAARYVVHHDPGDPWHGKTLDSAGFKERLSASRTPFPDQRFSIQELIAEGDKVVMTWDWSGTHKGDLPGFPASGRKIVMSGVTVYSFALGKIAGHWQIVDRLGVFQQLAKPA